MAISWFNIEKKKTFWRAVCFVYLVLSLCFWFACLSKILLRLSVCLSVFSTWRNTKKRYPNDGRRNILLAAASFFFCIQLHFLGTFQIIFCNKKGINNATNSKVSGRWSLSWDGRDKEKVQNDVCCNFALRNEVMSVSCSLCDIIHPIHQTNCY